MNFTLYNRILRYIFAYRSITSNIENSITGSTVVFGPINLIRVQSYDLETETFSLETCEFIEDTSTWSCVRVRTNWEQVIRPIVKAERDAMLDHTYDILMKEHDRRASVAAKEGFVKNMM